MDDSKNYIEQNYPLNGDHRIQIVKPKWRTLIDRSCKHSATNISNIKYGLAQESSLIYLQTDNHEPALQSTKRLVVFLIILD